MTVTSRDNLTFGAQIVTAVGMFIVTLGILFIATLTYLDREDQEFRNEIRTDLTEIRTAMRDMNIRLDNINTRLGRVEGYLRVSGEE
ncbi:MAG: hypothetical protein F4Y38_02685 [Gemmatimonadetes bacterium]|nr:hypothetical protein [Gemmatimonadota bacterium]MYG84391.1 hypothetical protein [Gemmatimonadota bacterium]MYJ88267.1 hypothetical protein [Gemmatimonadota bacterium]